MPESPCPPPGATPPPDTAAHVEGCVVEWTLRGAHAQGRDIAAILRRAALPQALAARPDTPIAAPHYAALLRTLKRVMRDELWGLCSAPVPPGTFGAACAAAIHCLTLQDAVRAALGHYRRHGADLAPRLHVVAGQAQVHFGHASPRDPGLADAARALFTWHAWRFASWLAGRSIPLAGLSSRGGPTPLGAQAARLLGAPHRHRQPYDGFSFDAHWLALPVARSASALRQFLAHGLAHPWRPAQAEAEVGERVRSYLRQRLTGQSPSMEQVAQALQLSTTSLMRRLQDEGLGFQYLKDGLRREVSMHYLQSSGLPLGEIAYRVGFSEPATFCRAFKKWTGTTPGGFRLGRSAPG
ncbi:AraC family transcriptional regulator [Pseudorhodoferax sp.]|uniref:AraC family transcriptional regulator n=1 Tax=Pseudorhodoferax sp. TaxID=1993553 RepID=UPI002DD67468|nr:AraC family transcriptional regulator ligand-binding domain-containing protein [Pseudorhodoferax sp.]